MCFIQSSVAKSKIYERIYKIYKLNLALESKQGVNRGEAAWALNLKRKIQVRALAARAVMLLAKIQTQIDQLSRVFGDSEKSKPLIYGAAGCLLAALITLLYLFIVYHVPTNSLRVWVTCVSSRKPFRARRLRRPLQVRQKL